MSKYSVEAKIEFILMMIENIYKIIDRHNGLVNTLDDTIEGKPNFKIFHLEMMALTCRVDLSSNPK